MCGVPYGERHSHVVAVDTRELMCTCRPCALLFTSDGAAGGRYRAVPERYLSFPSFALTRVQWDELQIPVSVAFFFFNSTLESVAGFYPGPAGATESLLPLDAWQRLASGDPVLQTMAPDVEAFLVRRDKSHNEAYIVPIDACYELVGELRRLWKGFDGGTEAGEALDAFFDRVRERAHP